MRGLVIPASDEAYPIDWLKIRRIDLQTLVGGNFELVGLNINGEPATMICCDDGIPRGLPRNEYATLLIYPDHGKQARAHIKQAMEAHALGGPNIEVLPNVEFFHNPYVAGTVVVFAGDKLSLDRTIEQ